ncbi:MAG: SGNH/GDSL hydrolase family protein [Clostridia bacterium]|nr:SGNH/GDSL hydrolase family protein [Clostridia bacterium]
MKLTEKTLMKLVKGAINYSCERGYITFYRFGKNQMEYMAREEYDYGWRNWAKFSGGIRLEFKTDSENIDFDYKASCSHERANTVDLYINDTLTCVYKIGENLKGRIHFDLPDGTKKVTVYFPGESIFSIKNFTIDGNYKSIKDTREKLLVYGDSITQGAGPEFASVSYVNILNREYKFNILNQGIGGYRYEPCDLMKVEGFEPDKIMVALGTNYYDDDMLERCGYDYEKAVREFYKRLNGIYPNVPKLVFTILYKTRDLDEDRLNWCREVIKNEALKYPDTNVIDGETLMPNDPVTLSDGVHPSTYGSIMIGKNLMKKMKEIKF